MPIVCVLDRGCRRDLTYSGSAITNGITITPTGTTGDGSPILDVRGQPLSHGTLCAGVLANMYSVSGGVADSLQLMSVAIQDDTGPNSADEIARGITWATDHGAHVISMSLTFTPTNFGSADATLINSAIQYAIDHNVVFCAATGNQNQAVIHYPANQSGVIAVGACTSTGQRVSSAPIPNGGGATWGSNYGLQLSVVALGVNVPTGLAAPLNTFYGTSAAAPQVAALAALITNSNPNLCSSCIRSVIESNADHPSGGRNNEVGYGRINVSSTLIALNNKLSALSVTPGPLNPAFQSGTSNYRVDVGTPNTQVGIEATKSNPNAVMVMNGSVTTGAGIATGRTTIQLGGPGTSTLVTIIIVAPYGNQRTYTITVTRQMDLSPPPAPSNLRIS